MERVDCVVIGAGVVGLACARALALAGREVIVLEAAGAIGTETSSRNSEVIHAGIHYPTGSAKAVLCVQGRALLYRYCEAHGVAHRRCGKLIVATEPEQIAALHQIQAQAAANGVHDLRLLAADEARAMEPQLRCVAALHSPSTGIIDSHGLMLACQGEAEDRGAMLALHSPVRGGEIGAGGIMLDVGGTEPVRIFARTVINSAGLMAQRVADSLNGLPKDRIPPCHYAKGNYYSLSGRSPFSRLIYPVPEAAGLGVHLTLDLAGQARFGPDVEWITEIDYDVDLRRADGFYRAIRDYWPGLRDGQLAPGYAGIRPKLGGPNQPASDFLIQGPLEHGVPGLVNLFGIESPGLTASLALAEHVVELAGKA
ncbi:MAG: NAD(P)/FAD-dependent oxidoreductase [Betaproteobacteria bacterium]|nr:NAD(P)/FAD-dependent oxidoreductase [Betaproteobacteria bacterium]